MKLYHYTTLDSFAKIWVSKQLKFSPSQNTNDMFEREKLFHILHQFMYDLRPSDFNIPIMEYWKSFNAILYGFKQISLVADYNDTPGYKSPLMWGHYAKRHHGFCIQYELEDGSPLLNDGDIGVGKRCRMDKVIYRDDLVSSDGALLSYEKCFLVKKEAWSYENEYRIVYYDANRDEQYYNVSLDSIGLKTRCVYFGLNCSNGNRAIVQQLLKNKDVSFYEIVRDENYLNKLEIKAF